jgi:hypothetical protein
VYYWWFIPRLVYISGYTCKIGPFYTIFYVGVDGLCWWIGGVVGCVVMANWELGIVGRSSLFAHHSLTHSRTHYSLQLYN